MWTMVDTNVNTKYFFVCGLFLIGWISQSSKFSNFEHRGDTYFRCLFASSTISDCLVWFVWQRNFGSAFVSGISEHCLEILKHGWFLIPFTNTMLRHMLWAGWNPSIFRRRYAGLAQKSLWQSCYRKGLVYLMAYIFFLFYSFVSSVLNLILCSCC